MDQYTTATRCTRAGCGHPELSHAAASGDCRALVERQMAGTPYLDLCGCPGFVPPGAAGTGASLDSLAGDTIS